MHVTSVAFAAGETIPRMHTCDGENVSPPLAWSNVPPGTRAFAVIADDPDAPRGTWVHWVLYDLPDTTRALPQNVPPAERMLANGGVQGTNDFRAIGYGGPCPPPGAAHRYSFRVYALDAPLALAPGATKSDVERAMHGHTLAHGELIGLYGR